MIVLLDIPNRLLRDLAERLEPADDMSALILRALYFAVKQIPRYQGPEAVRTAVATQADTAVSTKLPTTGSTALPTTQPGTVSAVTDQDISDQLDCLPWKEMKSGKGYWARFEELPQPYPRKVCSITRCSCRLKILATWRLRLRTIRR